MCDSLSIQVRGVVLGCVGQCDDVIPRGRHCGPVTPFRTRTAIALSRSYYWRQLAGLVVGVTLRILKYHIHRFRCTFIITLLMFLVRSISALNINICR